MQKKIMLNLLHRDLKDKKICRKKLANALVYQNLLLKEQQKN